MSNKQRRSRSCWLLLLVSAGAQAGEAEVLEARASPEAEGRYRFEVTVRHADEGWDHYADGWEILTPAGSLLARRTLYHPHVDEQPFRRSLAGVSIPAGLGEVRIRAHDSRHGYGGRELVVPLDQ